MSTVFSPKHIILFSSLAQLTELMQADEETCTEILVNDDGLTALYASMANTLDEGIKPDDFDNLCQQINKTYADLGGAIDDMKGTLKTFIKED